MVFCGQCGFQLAPGDMRCPRCGTATDAGTNVALEEPHTDDATIAASYIDPAVRTPEPPQAKLVLRPGADYDYAPQTGNEATSRVGAPDYQPAPNASYPGYPAPTSYPTPGTSYPGFANQGYQMGAGQYDQRHAAEVAQRAKGRTASLVVILLGLLLVLGAMVLFALQRNGVINLFGSGTASNATPAASTTATTSSPVQQARAVVQQLYTSVNNKDYRTAYDLWKPDSQQPSLATFTAGYAHTRHTDLTITDAQLQSDGTVKVSVRLLATEDATGGTTKQTTYQGYYIVQQQSNGTWLIQHGTLQKV